MKNNSFYSWYIKSTEWANKRKEVYQREKDRNCGLLLCQKCGDFDFSRNPPEVHHQHYRTLGQENTQDNTLIILCRECHQNIHFPKPKLSFIDALIKECIINNHPETLEEIERFIEQIFIENHIKKTFQILPPLSPEKEKELQEAEKAVEEGLKGIWDNGNQ